MGQFPILHFLGTHRSPHRDEACAFWLIKTFGDRMYQFARDFQWYFFDSDEEADAFAKDQKRRGRQGLLIGIGTRGNAIVFNEHGDDGREKDCSAALLIARHLGVHEDRSLRKILEIVTEADSNGGQALDSQASLIQAMHRYSGLEEWQVVERSFVEFDALRAAAIEFAEECPAEFERRGHIEHAHGVRIGFVRSNLISMAPWLRTYKKVELPLVRRDSGHVAMFFGRNAEDVTSGHAKALLLAVAPQIIRAEGRKLGLSADKIGEAVRSAVDAIEAGKAFHVPHMERRWYIIAGPTSMMLLNGSESQLGRPTTTLTNDELRAAVINGLAQL